LLQEILDDRKKSHQDEGFVKSSRVKTRKNRGVKRTNKYAATAKLKRNAADGLFTKPSIFDPMKTGNG
jgi:hypothetical protein